MRRHALLAVLLCCLAGALIWAALISVTLALFANTGQPAL